MIVSVLQGICVGYWSTLEPTDDSFDIHVDYMTRTHRLIPPTDTEALNRLCHLRNSCYECLLRPSSESY